MSCHTACRILVPWPGIQSGPWQWMCWVLTTGPLENSLKLSLFIYFFETITLSLSTLSLHPHSFPYNFAVPCPPTCGHHLLPTWSDFYVDRASLVTQTVKKLPTMAGDLGSILGSGRSPGEVNDNLLQYSCLKNLMDRGAWWATVHGFTKSRTRLSN